MGGYKIAYTAHIRSSFKKTFGHFVGKVPNLKLSCCRALKLRFFNNLSCSKPARRARIT